MRINKFLAQATGMSRRAADAAVAAGEVRVNDEATDGHMLVPGDIVTYRGTDHTVGEAADMAHHTIMLNKPTGYVVSRDGQGSRTVYDLLPHEYRVLKPIGRLDKNSSGLLLLTDDGDLANRLTHPSHRKAKVYELKLDAALQPLHRQMISDYGISLDDGPSKLQLERMFDDNDFAWRVTMHEGRNRQIRRTFAALGYEVIKLHRTHFGSYRLGSLKTADHKSV